MINKMESSFGKDQLTPKELKQFEHPSTYTKTIEWIKNYINKNVKGSTLPNRFYQSQADLYGGKIRIEKDPLTGREQTILDTTDRSDKTDIKGDKMVRAFDDNVIREPLKMLKRHPKQVLKRLPGIAEAKRYRAQTPEETYRVIDRLGLTEYFDPHKKGLLIKHPEIFTDGISLLDIFRQDIIDNTELNRINRFKAIETITEYIKRIHNERGCGLGDTHVLNFIFQKRDGSLASDPTLLLPNMQYNPKLNISLREQKATDLIDFIFSVGTEEARRSHGYEKSIATSIDIILNTYNDPEVINFIKSFMKRGRLTMQAEGKVVERPHSRLLEYLRPILSMHNKQRMKTDVPTSAGLRNLIIERCEEYARTHTS